MPDPSALPAPLPAVRAPGLDPSEPVAPLVEADLFALARRRARALAWGGLLVNLPLFYTDDWVSFAAGRWADPEAGGMWPGYLAWRVAAVVTLGAYLVADRRAGDGPGADGPAARRLPSVLVALFVTLGAWFGIYPVANALALPLYGFSLLLAAVLVPVPRRTFAWAALASVAVLTGGAALASGFDADVLEMVLKTQMVVVPLVLVVDRLSYGQALRNALAERRLEREKGRLEDALAALRATQARLVEAETQAERARISRDLHDSVGSGLSSLLAGVELARLGTAAPETLRALAAVEADARETMQQLRETVWTLRHEALTLADLAAQVARTAEARGRAHGVAVTVRTEGDAGTVLPPTVALQLFRIQQEAVANALRHSGAAAVEVVVRASDGRVALRVADDGTFREPGGSSGDGAPSGFGLASMRQRAEGLGGTFALAPGAHGTVVEAVVPVG